MFAALWGTGRATPIAGTGHQASDLREAVVTGLLAGGSIATAAAIALVLWGQCAWKD
jgi:(hydroxyamino)benzene mutase